MSFVIFINIVILFNKAFAKLINLKFLYTIDLYILYFFLTHIKYFLYFFKKNQKLLLIYFSFFLFLIDDIFYRGFTDLTLRKFAVFFYLLIPWLYIISIKELIKYNKLIFYSLIFLSPIVTLLDIHELSSSLLSEVLAILTIISFFSKEYFHLFPFTLISLLLVSSGILTGSYPYRTPLVVFISVFFSFFILNAKKISKNKFFLLFIGIYLIFAIMFLTGILGDILIGIGGLIDNSVLVKLGRDIGGSLESTRGDASGTTKTRVFFWSLIISHSLKDFSSFFIGNGFSQGFLDVLAPFFNFKDKSLIEPHNSFIGIFYKTGFIGLFLIFLYFKKIYRIENSLAILKNLDRSQLIPFWLGALLYASFEVALENPQGAFIFWFMIFSPIIFMKNR